jgi:3-hydroxyacyl-CoA dehydrogenase
VSNQTFPSSAPAITLVGAGVVGQAILRAHTDVGLSVSLADQDSASLMAAVSSLNLDHQDWIISEVSDRHLGLPLISLSRRHAISEPKSVPLLIESIPERLDLKRAFFSEIQHRVDPQAVLCSNTSTLRIANIADGLDRPHLFCGMHFFMPVGLRDAVELIRGDSTGDAAITRASEHIANLGKSPLVVRDSPGFIVNRLLSPYLNESLTLLCQGVSAEQLADAAQDYGMPMSPLELIDTIGARTMFDAGRVYWQAFPGRIDPSPMLAGLVKSKRLGKHAGAGLYDYDVAGHRSDELGPNTLSLIQRYHRGDASDHSLADLVARLSIPMWIEAAIAIAEGTVTEAQQFNIAMQGGLGYRSDRTWLQFFDDLDSKSILAASDRWSDQSKAIRIPPPLRRQLEQQSPSEVILALGST